MTYCVYLSKWLTIERFKMSSLTSEAVQTLFEQSVRESGGVFVEGIRSSAYLDVTGKEQQISELLVELPNEFQASKGGGWSFLNACLTRDGEQWTDLHLVMEKLFMLGIAAGKARWLMPRDMWKAFPGGMPYVVVNCEGKLAIDN